MESGNLILTRRVGESLQIAGNITVTLGEIRGNQARLIINAPKDITVHRSEIAARINGEENLSQDDLKQRRKQAWFNLKRILYDELFVVIKDADKVEKLIEVVGNFKYKQATEKDLLIVREFLDEFEHNLDLSDILYDRFKNIEKCLLIKIKRLEEKSIEQGVPA